MHAFLKSRHMKKIILCCLLLTVRLLQAQPGFIKVFDSLAMDKSEYRDVLVDEDTVVYYSSSYDENHTIGMRFVKMDTFGNILANVIYADSINKLKTLRWRNKIIKTSDGGYMIAGGTTPINKLYLLKVHHDLSLDFLKFYDNPVGVDFSGNSSLLEVDDGYMMAGEQVADDFEKDIFVIKTNKIGEQLWRQTYHWSNTDDGVFEIKSFGNNSFVLGATQAEQSNGNQGTWNKSVLFSIDSIGELNWLKKSSAAPNRGPIIDFELLPDSSWIVISGTWELNPPSNVTYWTRPMVLRMDKDFNVLWERIYPILSPYQFFTDLERTPDGNFLASGWMDQEDDPLGDGLIKGMHFKFNASGDTIWTRSDSVYPDSLSGYDGTRVTGTAMLSSGSIISVGYAERNWLLPNPGTYGFVMKMSPDGCIDTLNCHPVADYEPFVQADELQVYPNPAQDYVTFEGAIKGDVVITDLLGREVKRLRMNGLSPSEWSVGDVTRGLYVWRLVDDGVVLDVGKVLVE